jgi:hypothetical protein
MATANDRPQYSRGLRRLSITLPPIRTARAVEIIAIPAGKC